ncbi:MAG TPA: glycosyl hydrolase [Opitutaceae bacterium]|nr:glycosyl hydrolase [Opitutaceae bacterium]
MRWPIVLVASVLLAAAAERPWQELSNPTAAEVAAHFPAPPPEYGLTVWWGWDGAITPEVISRDLDAFQARGIQAVTIEAGYGMSAPYLSPGWFETVREAVEQAKRRGMRVWLVDEGKYPSGFAGGLFSAERPDLRMQALVVGERIQVAAGETVARSLPGGAVGALAVNQADGSSEVLDVGAGELRWTAPAGQWEIRVIRHEFRSSPTRSANNPTRGKDATNSLEDYLDPAATHQFIAWTHEQYAKYVGGEFGKTVLGFRGDEPDYSIEGIPWTPAIYAQFEQRKGYDVRPCVPGFFAPHPIDAQRRAKADYWDVWSDLFRDGFFRPQADWCAAHGLEYLVHLNHEDQMVSLVRSEGDFFKDMRYVQVPGIDTIWHQIWPGQVSDFPKYASSAAHVFGRPRAFTESFAAYRPPPSLEQARWIMNQQYVRGINLQEVMFVPASSGGVTGLRGWMADERFPAVVAYANRATFLLAQGRPAARVAVYYPTLSLWLGDDAADKAALALMQQLLERQRDFDFINEEAFATALTVEPGVLRNLSGQAYQAVIVPPVDAISQLALDRLHALAEGGGRVVFLGPGPGLVVGRNALQGGGRPDLGWAVHEPSGTLTPGVLASLPAPDVVLDQPCPAMKYLHRRWHDADFYFFFNESDQRQARRVTLAGGGRAQAWDAKSGGISLVRGAEVVSDGTGRLPLELEPFATLCIVVGALPPDVADR